MKALGIAGTCALAAWLCAGAVHAQSRAPQRVVVLVSDDGGERELRAQILDGLRMTKATSKVEVVELVGDKADPVLGACRAVSCAQAVVKHAAAGFALLAKLTFDAQRAPESLQIDLVAADGRSTTSIVKLASDSIAQAASRAFEEAVTSFDLGNDALLSLKSTPVGALLTLDGELVGIAPSALRVKPGTHVVAATLAGFVGREQEVEALGGRSTDVVLVLERAPFDRALTAASGSRAPVPSAWNYVLGGALVIAALPAIVLPLDALAGEGRCVGDRDTAGRCSEAVTFGTPSAVLLGAGVASLAVGTYLLWATPFSVDAEVSPDGASFAVSGRM